MKHRKKHLLFGCLAALVLFAGAFPAYAKDRNDFSTNIDPDPSRTVPVAVDITAVYGRNARLGSFVPIKVSLCGQTELPFSGTLSVSTLESNNDEGTEEYEYSYQVEVGPAETKTMELYVPLGQKSGTIHLTLKDEKNRTMGETSMDFDVSKEDVRLFAGVLGKKEGSLSWLDGTGLNYGMITARVVEIPGDDFPEDSRGFSMFDVMFVNGYDCRMLKDSQKEAVLDWVKNGGTLLVDTGRDRDLTLDILGEAQEKVTLKDPEVRWVGMGTEYTKNRPGDSEVRVTYTEPVISGAEERMVADGTPLLKTLQYGKGTIGVYGVNLSDLSGFAKKNPAFAPYFLGEIFNDNELNTIYYNSQGRDADYWKACNLVIGGNGERLPNLTLYAIIVVGYLVIVGPGLYVLLKKRGLNRYYGTAVFVFSAAACVVIWGMGFKTRFTSEFCTTATILDASGTGAKEMTFLNIRTPDSSGFTVDLPSDYKVTPLTRSGRYDTNQIEDYRKKHQTAIGIRKEADQTVLWSRRSKAFDSRFFFLERKRDQVPGNVDADFTVSDGTITGYVENTLPVTLENAAVYLYGQVLILGDLEPGQRLEFDREPLKVWPVGMTWMLSDALTGTPDRQEDSDGQYIENVQKSGLGAYFADRYYASYNGEVRLGAFLPAGYEGDGELFGKNRDGRIFYTQEIPCAMGTDGQVYRCGQLREPSVTSGMGASYGNSMMLYGTDPAVVEYAPGSDLVIEKYSFLPVSDEFFQGSQYSYIRPFSGEASFYNQKTGSYDPVDIRKQDFSREELADYIAADGKITVRYTGGSDAENGISQTLPLLMVTGRENGC